jgi:hypothetical protein
MSDEIERPVAGEGHTQKLQHKRADRFVEEFVDKFSLIGLQVGKESRVQIQFGRDSAFIDGESSVDFVREDGESRRRVEADDVSTYRLDVVGLTLPLEAVRELHGVLGTVLRREDDDE